MQRAGKCISRALPPGNHQSHCQGGGATRAWLLIARSLLTPLDAEFPTTLEPGFVGKLDDAILGGEIAKEVRDKRYSSAKLQH